MNIRLVGDVHQKQDKYINLVKDCDYSFQLGDMGFNYDKLKVLDPWKHKVLFGNHDRVIVDKYDEVIREDDRFLTNYGNFSLDHMLNRESTNKSKTNIPDLFYVRGDHSIDKAYRTPGLDWFEDEQLTYYKMLSAIECYTVNKPKIVISHGCPSSIIPYVANPAFAHLNIKPSATSIMLEEMYRIHQPDFWFFGHFHRDKVMRPNDDTYFFCIDELSYIDLSDTDTGYRVDAQYYKVDKFTAELN